MLTTCWSPPTTTCDSYQSAAPKGKRICSLYNSFSYINRVTHDCDRSSWIASIVLQYLLKKKMNIRFLGDNSSHLQIQRRFWVHWSLRLVTTVASELASESVRLKGGCPIKGGVAYLGVNVNTRFSDSFPAISYLSERERRRSFHSSIAATALLPWPSSKACQRIITAKSKSSPGCLYSVIITSSSGKSSESGESAGTGWAARKSARAWPLTAFWGK